MTTSSNENLTITRHFDSPRELVYDAWVNPDLIKKWLFVSPSSELLNVELDPKPGGKFAIKEHNPNTGEELDYSGQYLEVKPSELLSFSLTVSKVPAVESTVSVQFDEHEQGCTLNFMQTGDNSPLTEAMWIQMFRTLKMTIDIQ